MNLYISFSLFLKIDIIDKNTTLNTELLYKNTYE